LYADTRLSALLDEMTQAFSADADGAPVDATFVDEDQ
jgi:hypothetical protein